MKTILLSSLVLVAAPAFAGDLTAQLTSQMEKWAKDFNAHDPKALAAHYTDDVQFIYAFEGQEGKTKAGIEQFYVQSFKMTPDISVTLKSYDVVQVSDDVAMGLGVWEDSFTGPDGKKVRVLTHASEVWVKVKGAWKVRLDHASFVPPPQPPPPAPEKAAPAKKK